MRFTIEQRFSAPLDRVEAALVDPAYLERLSALPKLGRPTLLERREDGGLVHQSVRYTFVGDLNAAVRRVVDPKRLTWVEEATTDLDTHVTTWRIVPDHYANLLRSHGTFRLEPVAGDVDGTRRTAEGELKVSVPFVGGKVEQAIVSGLREHAALEQDVLEEWLQDP